MLWLVLICVTYGVQGAWGAERGARGNLLQRGDKVARPAGAGAGVGQPQSQLIPSKSQLPAVVAPRMKDQATAAPAMPETNSPKIMTPVKSAGAPTMRANDGLDIDAVAIVEPAAKAAGGEVRRQADTTLPRELEQLVPKSSADFYMPPIQPTPRARHHRGHPEPRAHPAPPPPSPPNYPPRPIGREGPTDYPEKLIGREGPPAPASSTEMLAAPPAPAPPPAPVARATAPTSVLATTTAVDKRNKVEKFMVFINKNRDLLKEFIKSKRLQQGVTQPPPLFPARQLPPAPGALGKAIMEGLNKKHRKKKIARATSSSVSSESKEEQEAVQQTGQLNGNQLDMAPAKGSRINKMRQKGRICSRHVLYPEGPKYNSKGQTYMPEFVAKGNRYFYMTREPKFLLPMCCNCCAKSVLGCE